MPNRSDQPSSRITWRGVLLGFGISWVLFEIGFLIWWALYGFGLTDFLLGLLFSGVLALGATALGLLLEWRSHGRKKKPRYLGG
jgi:hypothetical protein